MRPRCTWLWRGAGRRGAPPPPGTRNQQQMEQDVGAHLGPVDSVEAAGSGGCGKRGAEQWGPCPGPGLLLSHPEPPRKGAGRGPGPPRAGPSGLLTIQEAPLGRQFLARWRLGSSTFGLLWREAKAGAGGGDQSPGRWGQPRQVPNPLLTCRSLSMWARHSSRSLSPGTTTVPSGTAGG